MTESIVALWLTVMLSFARHEPRERLETIARTVVEATSDPQEQALLLTISFYETGFGRGGIPFGLSSVNRRGHTLADDAQSSLRILRRSYARCERGLAQILGHYHHGNGCRPDPYSYNEAETVRRMVGLYYRRAYATGVTVSPAPVFLRYADNRPRPGGRRR